IGYVTAGSVYTLTAVRFLHGIASAMVVPIAMAYIGDLSGRGEEGALMAKFQVSFFLGLGSGPLLGGVLNDAFGFSSAFYAMAALSTLAFLVIVLFLPEAKRPSSRSGDRVSLRWAFRQPGVPAVMAFTALNSAARGLLLVFMPLYAPRISIAPGEVGVILTVSIFLMAFSQVPMGRMADRGHALSMIMAGSVVSAASLALIPATTTFWELFIAAAANGLGSALILPALLAVTVKLGRRMGMGTSMGAYNTAMSLGMITAPLLGGLVMDLSSMELVFVLGGAAGVGASGVVYQLTRRSLEAVEAGGSG
ncbi:MAG TPA: MFS transporter, partial [Methanothrix sp.]|nr:MFS transporter [Methanothrix sp.]